MEKHCNTKFVRLANGSPYFKDQWLTGNIVTAENKMLMDGRLKLDLVDHKLHYFINGSEKIALTPVKEVSLVDSASGETFHFVNSAFIPGMPQKTTWYEELVSGKTGLYRLHEKQVRENRPYGSATVEQYINTMEKFYLLINGNFIEIKRTKDPVAYFPAQQKALAAYWNKSKGNMPERLKSLVAYYNSL